MAASKPTILATSMGFNRAREPWQPTPIFRYAFELAGSPSGPKLCFVTTGTGDKQSSIDRFYAAFEGTDTVPSHLALFDKPNVDDVPAHLRAQDVIWVDRGSVVNLLAVWRTHRLDTVLLNCWEQGVVLGGESAGSLCWFASGTTDSFGEVRPFTGGLGFLPYANAVHYGDRRELFHEHMKSAEADTGYATDAGAGLHFEGTELVAAVSDRRNAKAYRVTRRADGDIEETELATELLKR